MNHSEVIAAIGEATALPEDICERVVKAFEKVNGAGVLSALVGKSIDLGRIAEISRMSEVDEEECRKVLLALEDTVWRQVRKKFPF